MSTVGQFPVKIYNVILNTENRVFCLKDKHGVLDLPSSYLAQNEKISNEVERIVEKELNFCVGTIREDLKYYHARFFKNENGVLSLEMYAISRYISGKLPISDAEYQWVPLNAVDNVELTTETRRILYKIISNTDRAAQIILKQKGAAVILVARAMITNEKGEYLFLKRSSAQAYPDLWELPGGKLERLESLDTNLKREVLEETSLSIKIIRNNAHTTTNVMAEGIYKGITYVNITAECKVLGGKVVLSDEHVEYKWVTAEEARNLDLTTYIRPVVNELLS